MTEAEWLVSEDPAAMLSWLTESLVGPPAPSDRKLRLYACAMLRQFEGRMAVQAAARIGPAEDWADGVGPEPAGWPAHLAGLHGHAVTLDPLATLGLWEAITRSPHGAQAAALLREIAGNPWRPWWVETHRDDYGRMVARHPLGRAEITEALRVMRPPRDVLELAWRTPQVLTLAQAAYGHRPGDGALDPVRLAILADALEEAGCGEADWCPHPALGGCGGVGWVHAPAAGMPGMRPAYPGDRTGHIPCRACGGTGRCPPLLAHLRGPGIHVRGCWALDLVLGKE